MRHRFHEAVHPITFFISEDCLQTYWTVIICLSVLLQRPPWVRRYTLRTTGGRTMWTLSMSEFVLCRLGTPLNVILAL
jgi:hypothetical protein